MNNPQFVGDSETQDSQNPPEFPLFVTFSQENFKPNKEQKRELQKIFLDAAFGNMNTTGMSLPGRVYKDGWLFDFRFVGKVKCYLVKFHQYQSIWWEYYACDLSSLKHQIENDPSYSEETTTIMEIPWKVRFK